MPWETSTWAAKEAAKGRVGQSLSNKDVSVFIYMYNHCTRSLTFVMQEWYTWPVRDCGSILRAFWHFVMKIKWFYTKNQMFPVHMLFLFVCLNKLFQTLNFLFFSLLWSFLYRHSLLVWSNFVIVLSNYSPNVLNPSSSMFCSFLYFRLCFTLRSFIERNMFFIKVSKFFYYWQIVHWQLSESLPHVY